MRWGLDLLLGLVGILMGFASVWGWISGWEGAIVGLMIGLVVALVLGQFAGGKYFMNGFIVGIVSSLLSTLIIAIQFDTYFTHVAQTESFRKSLDRMAQAGQTMTVDEMRETSRKWALYFSPVSAGIGGAVQGLLAMLAGKIFGKKPQPVLTTDEVSNPPA